MRKGIVIGLVAGGATMFAICGGLALGLAATGDKINDAPPAFVENTRSAPPPTTTKPPVKVKSTSIGEGEFIVGTDVDAGTYRTPGASEGIVQYCLWSVRKNDDPSAEVLDFGSADKVKEPGLVTLKKGQYFTTSGCQPFVKR